ncbi:hypothetical protein M2132_001818 [Dysgonomonas sp. PH5-45]|uniref:DUF6712 family protein n=1 Tax=unclassified Dysgonomonas TaxID=2630389 RepID=UPI002474A690|nr:MULTISPECIES: DUF6712 family protein [unclassified Dysgonomonas]MDH6355475.1 hypothetical protein [Dysgonomonas sp. PH5-45]MDH6388371.1 hypothetical protein [Dysgonomonas sp. PH5-37]
MIFSEAKWSNGDEIRPYIPVSNALTFRTMRTAIQNAFGLFIRPVVGDKIVDKLQSIYDGITDISLITEDTTDKDIKLLYYAQRANAFLAYWYDYDELQVLIGDSGTKRQESDKAKTPYKYQELSLKEGFKQKGFDALDNLIAFLEQNIDDYPSYKESDNYSQMLTSIVRNATEVNEYHNINNSRLIFLRLKPNLRIIEDTVIAPRLGYALYEELKAKLQEDNREEKYAILRQKLIPVLVLYSIQKLILETGNVTDRGLFFSSLKGNEGSYASHDLVADNRITLQADKAEADAISYWILAERYVKEEFGISLSKGSRIPHRDNNHKKSYWA